MTALELYAPLPKIQPFHSETCKWRIVIGANRSGKTLCGAVELARAMCGKDPYGKYRRANGSALVIGLDYEHVGMLWRKLYLPGAFQVVRERGALRPIRVVSDPRGGYTVDSREKDLPWVDAPPLVPHEEIDSIAWYDRARYIPRTITMKNGWRVSFVSSRASPRQGEHYDIIWLDEQIINPLVIEEVARGVVRVGEHQGYAIWTATGQKQNPLLYDIVKNNEHSKNVCVIGLSIYDNPFIEREEVDIFSSMLTEDQRRVRIFGEFAINNWLVYPDFVPAKHVISEDLCDITAPTAANWTRYFALDPGTRFCATVFGAVNDKGQMIIYDELEIRNGTAESWAAALQLRPDANAFQYWIVDQRAGRGRSMGSSKTVAALYSEAAAGRGVTPKIMGPLARFVPGCDDPKLRREIVRRMLNNNIDGVPQLRIHQRCSKLIYQLTHAMFDEKDPDKRIGKQYDLLDAMEYLVANQPKFVPFTPSVIGAWSTYYVRGV